MTLTVNGSDENPTLYVNEDYQINIYAAGAAAIRAYNGWDWRYYDGDTLEDTWRDGTDDTMVGKSAPIGVFCRTIPSFTVVRDFQPILVDFVLARNRSAIPR